MIPAQVRWVSSWVIHDFYSCSIKAFDRWVNSIIICWTCIYWVAFIRNFSIILLSICRVIYITNRIICCILIWFKVAHQSRCYIVSLLKTIPCQWHFKSPRDDKITSRPNWKNNPSDQCNKNHILLYILYSNNCYITSL